MVRKLKEQRTSEFARDLFYIACVMLDHHAVTALGSMCYPADHHAAIVLHNVRDPVDHHVLIALRNMCDA